MSMDASGTSGAGSEHVSDDSVQSDQSEQTSSSVAYETHRKLLGEKKKLAEHLASVKQELEQIRRAKEEEDELKLKEQNEYKELYESTKQKFTSLQTELQQKKQEELKGKKREAFLSALNGHVDPKYWKFFDTELDSKVQIDPETGAVDEFSVAKYVEHFRKEHVRLIDKPHTPGVPNGYPKTSMPGQITYDEWKSLSLSEMKKYRKDQIVG